MKKIKAATVAAGGLLLAGALPVMAQSSYTMSGALTAEDFSYNYVQITYRSVDLDDTDVDMDGFGASGSWLIDENIFVIAGYAEAETDSFFVFDGYDILGPGKAKTESFQAGVGYRTALAPETDVNFGAALIRGKITVKDRTDSISDSDTGLQIAARIRHALTPRIELNGNVNYTDIFEDSGLGFGVDALLHATPKVFLLMGFNFSSDSEGWEIGARYKF